MSDESTDTTPKPPPPRRATARRRTTRRTAPPNTVSPGWIHEALALAALQALRNASDGRLDVGAVADDFVSRIPGAEDGPEPAALLARIFAHLGHRLPLIKRVEKRLEGRDRSSGLGSDALALTAQLYLRNRDLIPQLVTVARAAMERPNKDGKPSTTTTTPGANGGDAERVPFYVPPQEETA